MQKKIKITGTNENKTYKFTDEKYFQYKPYNSFTIIETDKPVYKPGQKSNFFYIRKIFFKKFISFKKVKLRILSVDFMLKPVSKVFKDIYIEDSSQSRVSQWTNIESNGILHKKMKYF